MDWTAQHTVELNEREQAFLEHSREASQAEIDRTRRMNRRLKGSLVGVAVFLVVALVGASVALQQQAHARAIATVAESKRLAAQAVAETDLGRSVQLALAGLTLDDSVDTRSALLQVLQRNPSAIGLIPTSGTLEGVAAAHDGRTVVADVGGSLAFFDTVSRAMVGSPVPVLDDGFPNEIASDPSGRTVAVAGVTGGVTYVGLVDARDHHVIPAWAIGRQTAAMSLAFSPNGKQLAVAAADLNSASLTPTTDRYIAFINPHTGGDPRSYLLVGTFNTETEAGSTDTRHFTSIAYLPDGTLAVSWFDGGTTIWDPSSGRRLKHFHVGGAAVAASSDGRTLAVGQLNGDVALIDVRTGAVRRMDGHHAGPVTGAVFTRDGRTVITSGIDGQIKLWDVATSRLLATFSGSGAPAVSPDGNTLYSSSSGSAIAVWDLGGTRGLTSSTDIGAGGPRFGIGGAGLVAFQLPGGPSEHATEIGLWDPATGATSSIPALPRQTCSASVSPDGSRLLESCDGGYGTKEQTDRNVAIWDVSSRSRIGSTMRSSGGATWDGAFSPDGSAFATASDDLFPVGTGGARTSTVIVRDAASMRTVWPYHLTGSASSGGGVVFSPDGRLIAATTDSDIRIWDTTTRLLVASPEAQDQVPVKSTAFSPDSKTLALALVTGVVRFLNTSTWTDAAPPIQAAADSIAYSPDGSYLAIADAGEVSLWDVASGRRVGSGYVGSPDHPYGTIRFLPDGRIVLMVTQEPAVIYRADLASWKAQACSIVGDVTPALWQQMAPDESYRSTCTA